jgi:hypothetical protein
MLGKPSLGDTIGESDRVTQLPTNETLQSHVSGSSTRPFGGAAVVDANRDASHEGGARDADGAGRGESKRWGFGLLNRGGRRSRRKRRGRETYSHTHFKVYKRRWFGLMQLVLLNVVVSWDVCDILQYFLLSSAFSSPPAKLHDGIRRGI